MKRSSRGVAVSILTLVAAMNLAACNANSSPEVTASTSARPTSSAPSAAPTSTGVPVASGPAPGATITVAPKEDSNKSVENFNFSPGWVSDGNLFFNGGGISKGQGQFFVPGFGVEKLDASPYTNDLNIDDMRVWPAVRDGALVGVAYLEYRDKGVDENSDKVVKNKAAIVVFNPETSKEISRHEIAIETPELKPNPGDTVAPSGRSLGVTDFYMQDSNQAIVVLGQHSLVLSFNIDSGAKTWQADGTVLGREGKTLVMGRSATDQECGSVVGLNAADGKDVFSIKGERWGVAGACETVVSEFQYTTGTWSEESYTGAPVIKVNRNGLQPNVQYVRIADGAAVKGPEDIPWNSYDPYSGFAIHDGQSVPVPKPFAAFNTADQKDIYAIPYENQRQFGVRSLTVFDGLWFLSSSKGSPVVDLRTMQYVAADGPGSGDPVFPVAHVGDVTCLSNTQCYVNFDARAWLKDSARSTDPKYAAYLTDPLEKPSSSSSRDDKGDSN